MNDCSGGAEPPTQTLGAKRKRADFGVLAHREGREMGFVAAIRLVLIERYSTFTGRASREEFWWCVLFVLLVSIAANVIDAAFGSPVL